MGSYSGVEPNWAARTDAGRTHIATKGIVQNGLVLNLDSGASSSYGGSGTTWTDLSGNGNNGTLVNGVGFSIASNSNGGSMVFDGINDYVSIANTSQFKFANTDPFSIGAWIFCTATSGFANIFAYAFTGGRGYYLTLDLGALRQNSFFFDYWDGGSFRGIQGNTNSISINTWTYLVATSSSNSVNDMRVYQNGVLTSYTNRGTGTPSTINYDTIPLQIGARGSGASAGYFKGVIPSVHVYNKALTEAEVQQNFNSMRGRYGI